MTCTAGPRSLLARSPFPRSGANIPRILVFEGVLAPGALVARLRRRAAVQPAVRHQGRRRVRPIVNFDALHALCSSPNRAASGPLGRRQATRRQATRGDRRQADPWAGPLGRTLEPDLERAKNQARSVYYCTYHPSLIKTLTTEYPVHVSCEVALGGSHWKGRCALFPWSWRTNSR